MEGANLSPRTAAEYARFGQNADEDKVKWASILSEKPMTRRLNVNIDPESLATIMKILEEDAAAGKRFNTGPNSKLLEKAAAAASDPSVIAAKKAAAQAAVRAQEAAARAAAAAERAATLAGASPVIVRRTLEQGDCFYSAVWRALDEQGLIARVNECLGIDCTTEVACILALRNLIADSAREYIADTYNTLYNLVASGSASDRETFSTLVSTTFAAWHIAVIKSSMMNPEAFMAQMVAGIRKPRNWASQIEVNILTRILEGCNIDLEILTRYRASLLKRRGGRDVVSLYNPNGVHFEYFSFILPRPVAPSPVTRSPGVAARSPGVAAAAARSPALLPSAARSPALAARSPALAAQSPEAQPRFTVARSPPPQVVQNRLTVARSPPPPVAQSPGAALLAASRARIAARSAAQTESGSGSSATPGAKRPRGGKRATRKRKHRN